MKKIMIIEDDKNLQEVYKKNFEASGYEVYIEGDGLEGISRVVEVTPDIILLDVLMPNMDGFTFMKAVKQNTSISVPVVVCSNLSDKATYEKALNEGASAVLQKVEYSGKDLVHKIDAIILQQASKKKEEELPTLS